MSDTLDLRRALEALIFSSEEPASAAFLRRALPSLAPSRLPDLVEEINEELRKSARPYEIVEVAGGYQFRTLPEFAEVLQAAQPERKLRLSRAALETLAVIAYRQPVTRPEVEEVRSVDSGAVLKSLLERGLTRIVGRRDAPGRPVLYGTSAQFLETFGLRSLGDLPTLRELDSLAEAKPGTAAAPTDAAPATDVAAAEEPPSAGAAQPRGSDGSEDDGDAADSKAEAAGA
jgi:segregation and condensation protein B